MIGLLFSLPCSKGAGANEVKGKLVLCGEIPRSMPDRGRLSVFPRQFSRLADRPIRKAHGLFVSAAGILVKGVVTDFRDIE
jgi:hypothetical protein